MRPKKVLHINEANLFLKNELAHLWPALTNISALQKECTKVSPQLFAHCHVLYLEKEQLVIAAPNSALASKLKQQLPKLELAMQKAGWPVHSIRIKIQTPSVWSHEPMAKQCQFSESALQAFSQLEKNLAGADCDDGLLEALRALLARHGGERCTG